MRVFTTAVFVSLVFLVLLLDGSTAVKIPSTWPSTKFEIGRSNPPWKVSEMEPNTLWRYQYLTGNPNNAGENWKDWNTPEGAFADWYVNETLNAGRVPVLTFYVILAVAGYAEGGAEVDTLNIKAQMVTYFKNYILLLQQCKKHESRQYPAIIHIEPDFWGYIQQKARSINAANPSPTVVPCQINTLFTAGTTEATALSGLPNNAAGFAQAFIALRNAFAPKVLLAYHMSSWGVNHDFSLETNPDVVSYGNIAGTFFNQLSAAFDLSFNDLSDRDSGFYQFQQGDPSHWWDAADFNNHVTLIDTYAKATNQPIIFWQIPFGNTISPVCDNTCDHYKDNRTEVMLADSRTLLQKYVNAGVLGLMFGAGAACCTTQDTDGGYWKTRVAAYYAAGAMNLAASTTTSPSGTTTQPSGSTSPGATTTKPSATTTKPQGSDANIASAAVLFVLALAFMMIVAQ